MGHDDGGPRNVKTPELVELSLLRPAGPEFPAGVKPFLAWGPRWGYRFDENGKWMEGRTCLTCGTAAAPQAAACVNPACTKSELIGQHGGEDVLMPEGTPLKTPADGEILRAGFQQSYGNSMLLKLDLSLAGSNGKTMHPLVTLAHCQTLYFDRGRKLKRGEVFGLSGMTGNAGKVPHCHTQAEEDGAWPRKPIRIKWVNK